MAGLRYTYGMIHYECTIAEAKEAVADIADARDVATKADVKAEVEKMGRIMIMWVVGVGMAVAGIVLAAVGLLIKFL